MAPNIKIKGKANPGNYWVVEEEAKTPVRTAPPTPDSTDKEGWGDTNEKFNKISEADSIIEEMLAK